MTELASIFDAESSSGDRRGPDIRVKVEVPSHALGDPQGYLVELPKNFERDGVVVERATVNPEDERGVRLFLPESLESPSVLRLRGQGGQCKDGTAGDLFVEIEVVQGRALVPIGARPLTMGIGATLILAAVATLLALLF